MSETDTKKTDSTILVYEGYDPQVVVGKADMQY